MAYFLDIHVIISYIGSDLINFNSLPTGKNENRIHVHKLQILWNNKHLFLLKMMN